MAGASIALAFGFEPPRGEITLETRGGDASYPRIDPNSCRYPELEKRGFKMCNEDWSRRCWLMAPDDCEKDWDIHTDCECVLGEDVREWSLTWI